ncbi:MAG: exodeoxyribonuclease VII large subunit [Tenericutes bacterium]|nr:exodeoxyribonuclease VII large subunit [Mycoplasmatota bacterium]
MEKEYLTVFELNKIVKNMFDSDPFFNRVYVKGEISNFKKQFPSGHCYFTIKDENSRISGVMFNAKASRLKFEPKDGDSVLIIGKVSVYEANGNYQLYVDSMDLDGAGDLFKKFLELKKELEKEGLFDSNHKKIIPKFPKKIGVVTASTGAAIRDIIITIKRRYPIAEIYIFPSLVQGNEAKFDITKKIEIANTHPLDVLIVGRGGGSIEDLWAFNEKEVAYAIYNSNIPIISAVGHEIDFTISDFVADLRAATPTAAAELCTPNIEDLNIYIDAQIDKASNIMENFIIDYRKKLKQLSSSYILKNPLNIYEVKKSIIINSIKRINLLIDIKLKDKNTELNVLKNNYILKNPIKLYSNYKNSLDNMIDKLILLDPLNALKRGYSILKKDDTCIDSIKLVNKDDKINISLVDGNIKANILELEEI